MSRNIFDEMMNCAMKTFDDGTFPDKMMNPFGVLVDGKTDIVEESDKYILDIDLPGFEKEELSMRYENDTLFVDAKKVEKETDYTKKYIMRERTRTVSRTYHLPLINKAQIVTKFEHGVLHVEIPKKEPETDVVIPIM